jgi:glutathione synthase/RimK-type ligase-like ATP-grasp enzyme
MERDFEDGRRVSLNSICILVPADDYEEDWSKIKADYLRLLGVDIAFRDWSNPGDLSGFSLVSPLIAWGYQRECKHWFALLDRMEASGLQVINPVAVLRWNTDKTYLAELACAGIATVPTRISDALNPAELQTASAAFGSKLLVIKPPVSGGADGTFRIGSTDVIPYKVAGSRMMIQPYLPTIASEGEFSLFYFDGRFSHAIIKRPAPRDFRVQDQFGGYEESIIAPDEAKTLAVLALAAMGRITNTGILAYARVDMVRDEAGVFRLMELELIEPSLFLHFAPDHGTAFAAAIRARLR